MHESPKRGFLLKQNQSKVLSLLPVCLARMCGCDLAEYENLWSELVSSGVPRQGEDGIWYCKRMVDEERLRKVRATAGKAGGIASVNARFCLSKIEANCDNDNDNGTSKSLGEGVEGGRLYGIPSTADDVIEYGKTLAPPKSAEICRSFFGYYEGQRKTNHNGEIFWATKSGAVISNWKAKLPPFEGTSVNFKNGHVAKKPLPPGMTREQAMVAFARGELQDDPT